MKRICLVVLVLTVAAAGEALAQRSAVDVARAYREAHGPQILRDFSALLAMPNVARDSVGINVNAAYLRDQLAALGVESQLLRLPGVP